ncbi:hypothetical protein [Actibacterium lipolyticum]|uniref:Uncharacterized protein n=1 Tax=Actibacterium lipolyticum TaxID=1524263 RepID=A0A238KWY9_9RHOB|nr:hypothetical protein [Actibacterium lipolyticum]SMX46586.1 hypothetical protein COL8621_03172 [Actibacterium lipolyticum]
MIAQVIGAIARALLVVLMIATPAMLLPSATSDATQIGALVAIFAGAMTLFEYSATYPGIVEFRDAPPFNRVRFGAMFIAVFLLTVICRGEIETSPMTEFVVAIAALLGQVLDFPYSPVHLIVLMLPDTAAPAQVELVRNAAGLTYFISILSLVVLASVIRVKRWPMGNGAFNVWVNLPTFDPTAGGDVVARLTRDARFNVAAGFLLPFLFPAVMKLSTLFFEPVTLENPQTLIWTISAWALLPASLFMRGIAIQRIANLINEQRRRAAPPKEEQVWQPV